MDAGAPAGKPGSVSDDTLMLSVKARLQRVGREMKMLVENADGQTSADPGLLRVVARAHDFQERLMQDPNLTVPAIANHERLSIGYMSRLLRLPTLAPDIITAIINGKNPPQLTAKKLMRLSAHLPVDWAEQRKRLGFQRAIVRVLRALLRDAVRYTRTKMLTPKCPPRDIRGRVHANSTKKRLCRLLMNLRGGNWRTFAGKSAASPEDKHTPYQ